MSVFPIEVPPLRERREDVPLLAAHFLSASAQRLKVKAPALTRAHAAQLQAYDWPGNVRELQNVVERAVILAQQGPLRFELERPKKPPAQGPVGRGGLEGFSSPSAPLLTRAELKARERESLAAALRQTNGMIAGPRGAAALLGMKPTTLTSRLKALGLRWEDLQGPPSR